MFKLIKVEDESPGLPKKTSFQVNERLKGIFKKVITTTIEQKAISKLGDDESP
jgi:hypothetical protein